MTIIIPKDFLKCSDIFLEEMEPRFRELGYDILEYKEKDEITNGEIVLTFNFAGLVDKNLREHVYKNEPIIIDILMDHPMYLSGSMCNNFKNYHAVCIDLDHILSIKKFYKNINSVFFMPLGGSIRDNLLSFEERKYDVCFLGNHKPEKLFRERFSYYKKPRSLDVIFSMINKMENNTNLFIDNAYVQCFPYSSKEQTIEDIPLWWDVDNYIRQKFRREVVKQAIKSGAKVALAGHFWEEFGEYKNVELIGPLEEHEGIKLLQNSRISLNTMPWFKQGTHDRIFSSCGCGALCLTDSSHYLNNILKDDVNVGIYKLENLSAIPEKINDYLNNPNKAKEIINNGFKLAEENSWYKRADCVNNIIQKVNINGGNKC